MAAPAKRAPILVATAPVSPATTDTATRALHRTSAGSIAKRAPGRLARPDAAAADAARLPASTVANLVEQWQPQLDLCYTEYGLKLNPALTGTVSLRLAIRPTGDVGATTVTRHNWSGRGGAEAELCIRTRAKSWMFPPSSTPTTHDFTVAFAP